MSKKRNTIIFIVISTLLNVLLMIALLTALSLIAVIFFKDHLGIAIIFAFILSIGLGIIIYQKALGFVIRKWNLEQKLDPLFTRPRSKPRND